MVVVINASSLHVQQVGGILFVLLMNPGGPGVTRYGLAKWKGEGVKVKLIISQIEQKKDE